MKVITRILIIAAGAAIITAPEAQIAKSGTGYTFKTGYHKGQVLKYTMNMTSTMPGSNKPMSFKMPMTMTVTDVKAGVSTISVSATAPGQSKPTTSSMKIDSQGNLVGGDKSMMGQFGGTNLPKGVIAIGKSWTAKSNYGGMEANAKYTFKGLKVVNGKSVAEIAVSMTSKGSSTMPMTMTGTGMTRLLAADGSLYNMSMNMKMQMKGQDGKPTNINSSMSMSRTN